MKKLIVFALAVLALTGCCKRSYETVKGDPMNARIYTLDNGLKVYLTKNSEKPEIQTDIVVRAGGQNDPLESTGLAHYLEHLMFKGTSQYGTSDYAAEKPNLDAIDSLYEVYSHTTNLDERKAIYHRIDSFSYEGSKIAIANEFDKLMEAIGATRLNAYTSTDRTCYHEVIPAGELRRWAMIESGRFRDMVVRGFHTELEAVYEEFNLNFTRDVRRVFMAANNILYPGVPYRQHDVIGTSEHLKNPSLKNIKAFYQTYYRPNNVAICLSGDLDYDHTMDIIEEYFGDWQSCGDLPSFEAPVQKPLAAHKDTVVYGQQAPMVWLAWTTPATADPEMDVISVIAEVLQNGKCGLLDELEQTQQLLSVGSFPYIGTDFTTFFLIAYPKDGQTLAQAKDLLLAQMERLKAGDFSEDMLQAIINNLRRHEMEALQSNDARADVFVDNFINGTPYADDVHEIDRLAKITKDDIVRIANKYFTDSYACIYKEQSDRIDPPAVEKPAITPIEMNRDKSSAFAQNLLSMEAETLTPQFLDFDKDLNKSTLDNGQQLLSRVNKENELFTLQFIINQGSNQLPALSLLPDYMKLIGTEELSASEFQVQLYALASEMAILPQGNDTYIRIYGLQENLPATLALLEQWVMTAQADEAVYQELVKDVIKAHTMAKADQNGCFNALTDCGMDGFEAVRRRTLTPAKLQALNGAKLLELLRSLVPQISRITYYGPATETELIELIKDSKFVTLADAASRQPAEPLAHEQVTKSEVWVAPYDAPALYLMSYANWGEKYDAKQEAIICLFNEYFSGSMGSVVFQELREARSLAYHASAWYAMPYYKNQNNIFYTLIMSQNDKLKDCVATFDAICNELPVSEQAFEHAKASLMKNIESRRYVRMAPINAYISFTEKGWDHDYYEDIYRIVPTLTMQDMIDFQKNHIANRTYRHLLLGNPKALDMKYLKTMGEVKLLTLDDIFIY